MTRRERDSSEIRFWVKLAAGWFVAAMVIVWVHVKAVGLDKEVRQLRRDADRMTYENSRLQMQIHQWMTPSNLDNAAKKNYGMAPLDSSRVIGLPK